MAREFSLRAAAETLSASSLPIQRRQRDDMIVAEFHIEGAFGVFGCEFQIGGCRIAEEFPFARGVACGNRPRVTGRRKLHGGKPHCSTAVIGCGLVRSVPPEVDSAAAFESGADGMAAGDLTGRFEFGRQS